MSTSVVYPARSAPALGYLKSSQNDIEVFVEDSAAPNMWVKLLKRYLPEGTRLNSVSTLGGRQNVLAACRADQVDDGRRKLYIIDGDLDLISGNSKPRLKHLYRLRAYCVENYLLNQSAIVSIATTFDEGADEQTATALLDLSSWLSKNERCLADLFICYGACLKFNLSVKTVSFSPFLLKDDNQETLHYCPQKTRTRVLGLFRKLLSIVNAVELRTWLNIAKQNFNSLGVIRAASAKDYILPFIFEIMKRGFQINISKKVFKSLLAEHADNGFDPYLRRRLYRL